MWTLIAVVAAIVLFFAEMVWITYAFARGFAIAFRDCLPRGMFIKTLATQTAIVFLTAWVPIVAMIAVMFLFFALLIGGLNLAGEATGWFHIDFDVALWGSVFFGMSGLVQNVEESYVGDKQSSGLPIMPLYGYLLLNLFGVQLNTVIRAYERGFACYSFDPAERLLFGAAAQEGTSANTGAQLIQAVAESSDSHWISIPLGHRHQSPLLDDVPSIFATPAARLVFWSMLVAFGYAVALDRSGEIAEMGRTQSGTLIFLLANFVFGAIYAVSDHIRLIGWAFFVAMIVAGLVRTPNGRFWFVGFLWAYVWTSLASMKAGREAWQSLWVVRAGTVAKDTMEAGVDMALTRWLPLLKMVKDYSLSNLFGFSPVLWFTTAALFTYLAYWSPQGRLFFKSELFRPTVFGPLRRTSDTSQPKP